MTATSPPPGTAAELMTRITAELSTRLAAVGRERGSPGFPVLVAVAHGSRDPEAVRTVRALLAGVRELRPEVPLRLGHVELNAPLLRDTLGSLASTGGDAVLVPLLFGRGHHVTEDIPEAVRVATARPGTPDVRDRPAPAAERTGLGTATDRPAIGHPAPAPAPPLSARVAAPLGPHPLLADALADRLTEAGWRGGDGVVLAAAGSRASRSAADTEATAALLAARLGVPVLPAYASAAAPTVAEAARTLAARGCRRVGVACCFTAPGLFARRTAATARGLGLPVAAPLGAHPALARLVLHRYDEQLAVLGTPTRTAA
ncbi:sirohydrochlorin chelatase [Streptomyces sp. 184]|uniref:sirohydrochlorin chelatase n=1 Tax=Streptomyces sp. 184 TaxID=1827526 RepID=UPI00389299EA